MTITLYHHPFSRASDVVWMLEELEVPYDLEFVDLKRGEQREDAHAARNRMRKLPVIEDGGVYTAERSAIGLYLADRYAPGRLAPALDAPERGPFLRWCFYASSVIEPCCMAKGSGWKYGPGQAGFGRYEDLLDTLDAALADGPYLLGERFTMADVIVGGTMRWMVMFKMLDAQDAYTAYIDRLNARDAYKRSREINDRVIAERGLA